MQVLYSSPSISTNCDSYDVAQIYEAVELGCRSKVLDSNGKNFPNPKGE